MSPTECDTIIRRGYLGKPYFLWSGSDIRGTVQIIPFTSARGNHAIIALHTDFPPPHTFLGGEGPIPPSNAGMISLPQTNPKNSAPVKKLKLNETKYEIEVSR